MSLSLVPFTRHLPRTERLKRLLSRASERVVRVYGATGRYSAVSVARRDRLSDALLDARMAAVASGTIEEQASRDVGLATMLVRSLNRAIDFGGGR